MDEFFLGAQLLEGLFVKMLQFTLSMCIKQNNVDTLRD